MTFLVIWALTAGLPPSTHSFLTPAIDFYRKATRCSQIRRKSISSPTSALQLLRANPSSGDGQPEAFDFSSTRKWETFYQQLDSTSVAVEWHSSVPLTVIANHVPTAAAKRCLLVGCGNSELPTVLRAQRPECHLTLLDSSPTCMASLTKRYSGWDKVEFLSGDVLQLSSLLLGKKDMMFDVVLDKGLLDVFLCGDDWNRTVIPLLEHASCVLHKGTGLYILVSFKLPRSTKEFLQEVGEQVGLDWDFDVGGSTDGVGISIAKRMAKL
jgi:hypothetical protein